MNVLIIGQNSKQAKVFSLLPSTVYVLLNKKIKNFRLYNEVFDYNIIDSNTNNNFINIFKASNEISEIVKQKQIDIVFTNDKYSMVAAYLATCLLANKPMLLTTSHNSYAWSNRMKVWLFSKMIKFTTDGYLSLASFVKKKLNNNGLVDNRIFNSPNPIESNLFEKKTSYCIKSKIAEIIYIGVIDERKGHLTLIESIAILKDKGIEIKLSIVGDIQNQLFYKLLQKKITEFGLENNINFLGRIENHKLHNLLHLFDIYVCPSQMEMSPYNILEAKITGLPIIATNVGGIPDIITNRVDGILVESRNAISLSSAIHSMLIDENLREKLGKAAYTNAKLTNSPEFISNNFRTFLNNLKYKG